MLRRENMVVKSDAAGTMASLQVTLVRPETSDGGQLPAVVLNRGLAGSDADIDLMDALAVAMAEAGVIAANLEPRTANLILDDLNAYSLAQEVGDVLAVVRAIEALTDVSRGRVGLVGWSIGAVAALDAAAQSSNIARLCLLNPATASLLALRSEKPVNGNGGAPLEPLPTAFREPVLARTERELQPPLQQPLLIVHAAADRTFPADSSEELLACGAAGAERVLVARADHSFSDPDCRAACFERLATFLSAAAAARSQRASVGAAT